MAELLETRLVARSALLTVDWLVLSYVYSMDEKRAERLVGLLVEKWVDRLAL